MARSIFKRIVSLLFRWLTRLDVTGLEHIPPQGAFIVAANHLSRLDGPLVFALLPRSDVTGLIADTYQKNPFFRWIINLAGGIWINRDAPDIQALRRARDFLRSGGLLGIAPEGTRSRTGALQKAHTGIAFLAEKAGVPVIPVAVWGTEAALPALLHLRRHPVHVHFGVPLVLPPLDRSDRPASLERNTETIMAYLAALLPPEYRGVYAQGSPISSAAGEPEKPDPNPLPE